MATGEEKNMDQLSLELHRCVKKDQLVRARFLLKGVKKEDRRNLVSRKHEGNAPLFVAAQQGLHYFINFLIEECFADIEQKGVYEVHEDHSKHQVSPLWCAAVANKLEVVKCLIRHGAQVNATSDTQSTPVRSACYMTNIEIVKILVENGADIHKPNVNGGTCLINSVQSVDLCRFLIEKGADVNAEDNSGNLALHYAIREGRVGTVHLLLSCLSDPYMKNDFGDDAIQTAALRGHVEIFEYLMEKVKPSKIREIEANELMASNYVDEKHDLQKAIQLWRRAMELRYSDTGMVIHKPVVEACHAYKYVCEADTMDALENMAANPDEIYMQALLVRERILGPDHKDTLFGLMYRGAVYADTHRYQRCVDLWKYAFSLRHRKLQPLNHECLFTLQALCKLFWEIFDEHTHNFSSEPVKFYDVFEIFQMALEEVTIGNNVLIVRPANLNHLEEFHVLLQLILHLIHLLCRLEKDDDQLHKFVELVHKILQLNIKGTDHETLLHLAVDSKTSFVSEEFYSHFPNNDLVETLLQCNAVVNARDLHGNIPLHLCGRKGSNERVDKTVLSNVVRTLLRHGSHPDARNNAGKFAYEEFAKQCKWFIPFDYVSLKCLAARVVREQNIVYHGEVPTSLIPFIELH